MFDFFSYLQYIQHTIHRHARILHIYVLVYLYICNILFFFEHLHVCVLDWWKVTEFRQRKYGPHGPNGVNSYINKCVLYFIDGLVSFSFNWGISVRPTTNLITLNEYKWLWIICHWFSWFSCKRNWETIRYYMFQPVWTTIHPFKHNRKRE